MVQDSPTSGLPMPSWKSNRARTFVLVLMMAFLIPAAVPNVGLDYPYFFVFMIVLFAWFIIKWESVKSLTLKSTRFEMLLAVAGIGAIYVFKLSEGTPLGILDLLLIFIGVVIFSYGLRALKLFWVPAAYGVVLLVGYQIELYVPDFVALQNWLAGLMVSALNVIGVSSTLSSGHYVALTLSNGQPVVLDVEGACTGLQGILAFGMLSTMALLDTKPKLSMLIPIFAIGFLGAFLINILRLFVVFLTFEYLGVDAGTNMHFYFGYVIFIAWVLVFWAFAFKYLTPRPLPVAPVSSLAPGLPHSGPEP